MVAMQTLAAVSFHTLAVTAGLLLIGFTILESFETLVLPRRIERPLRLTALFYRVLWRAWKGIRWSLPPSGRDNFLAVFGPLLLLVLLIFWGFCLTLGFALLYWGTGADVHTPEGVSSLSSYFYFSATTFITLGYGDIYPITRSARVLADIEAGTGFGFLAIVIGYLPVLYGSFSRREVDIALLDARASSPPSAGEMLRRVGQCEDLAGLDDMLRDYERWSAELIESHLSFPVLMYYRSQHDRQSWVSALTSILDTCAYVLAKIPSGPQWQARMTFAMSRHAAVDLALVFNSPPTPPDPNRLPPERLRELDQLLIDAGITVLQTPEADARLNELRALYEPFVNSLSQILVLALPSWMPNPDLPDNWQTSAWDRDDHFFQIDAADTGPAPVRRPGRSRSRSHV